MPWKSCCSTPSETFEELEAGLSKEFPTSLTVKISDAEAGDEEELLKLLTLLMYLVLVKHPIPRLIDTLQDSNLFNKAVQSRVQYILQVSYFV